MVKLVKELVRLTENMGILWKKKNEEYIARKNKLSFTVKKDLAYDRVIISITTEKDKLLIMEKTGEDYIRELYSEIKNQLKAKEVLKELEK